MASDASHTAGPWHILASTFAAKQHHSVEVNDRNGQTVAYALNFVPRFADEGKANARLIAAAPELLEALEALFASYKQLADSGDAGNWSLEDDVPEGKQALAAIAKAKGGAK